MRGLVMLSGFLVSSLVSAAPFINCRYDNADGVKLRFIVVDNKGIGDLVNYGQYKVEIRKDNGSLSYSYDRAIYKDVTGAKGKFRIASSTQDYATYNFDTKQVKVSFNHSKNAGTYNTDNFANCD